MTSPEFEIALKALEDASKKLRRILALYKASAPKHSHYPIMRVLIKLKIIDWVIF